LVTLVLAGFDLIKLFWCKFSHTFFKPDHFITKEIFLFFFAMRRLSLQKE